MTTKLPLCTVKYTVYLHILPHYWKQRPILSR